MELLVFVPNGEEVIGIYGDVLGCTWLRVSISGAAIISDKLLSDMVFILLVLDLWVLVLRLEFRSAFETRDMVANNNDSNVFLDDAFPDYS
jgi:hypothetical protein